MLTNAYTTNDLKNQNVEEILDLVTEAIEKSLQKAKKVVISLMINREDDPLIDAKAAVVNAKIKFMFLNHADVVICTNENLKDIKFRVDKIHLN